MRTTLLAVLSCAGAMALLDTPASGQATYEYLAQTAAPATQTGAVTAGTLIWQCGNSTCRISGPWTAPGVPACAALAAQVGRIASYGRSGAMLSAAQLGQCNANLPVAQLRIDPRQTLPRLPQPRQIQTPGDARMTPGATAIVTTPTQVAIEPGSRPEDMRVFALSGATISFHGTTSPLSSPPLPAPVLHVVDGRITLPALTLQASAPGATPTPRSSTTPPPFYRYGAHGDVTIRVPVSMQDLPENMLGLVISCGLSRGRYVPSPVATSPYVALWSEGSGTEEAEIATGEADVYIGNSIGRWDATIDIPLQLRPFQRLEDARSYACSVRVSVDRVVPPGREQIPIESLVDPTSASSRPPYRPAAGTTPQLRARGNIQ